jgi:hypothetical protein
MMAPQFAMFGMTQEGRDMIGEQPRLAAWLKLMMARPSMIRTDPSHALAR